MTCEFINLPISIVRNKKLYTNTLIMQEINIFSADLRYDFTYTSCTVKQSSVK